MVAKKKTTVAKKPVAKKPAANGLKSYVVTTDYNGNVKKIVKK